MERLALTGLQWSCAWEGGDSRSQRAERLTPPAAAVLGPPIEMMPLSGHYEESRQAAAEVSVCLSGKQAGLPLEGMGCHFAGQLREKTKNDVQSRCVVTVVTTISPQVREDKAPSGEGEPAVGLGSWRVGRAA